MNKFLLGGFSRFDYLTRRSVASNEENIAMKAYSENGGRETNEYNHDVTIRLFCNFELRMLREATYKRSFQRKKKRKRKRIKRRCQTRTDRLHHPVIFIYTCLFQIYRDDRFQFRVERFSAIVTSNACIAS